MLEFFMSIPDVLYMILAFALESLMSISDVLYMVLVFAQTVWQSVVDQWFPGKGE